MRLPSSRAKREASRGYARLHLLGDGEVLERLSELVAPLGYDEIRLGDDPPATLDAEDHVVVAVASPARGRDLLARLLAAGDAGYLGLVATEKDALISLLKLAADRIPKARIDRVAAPAGVAVGAVTPAEQAIAIAAELIAARRRRSP